MLGTVLSAFHTLTHGTLITTLSLFSILLMRRQRPTHATFALSHSWTSIPAVCSLGLCSPAPLHAACLPTYVGACTLLGRLSLSTLRASRASNLNFAIHSLGDCGQARPLPGASVCSAMKQGEQTKAFLNPFWSSGQSTDFPKAESRTQLPSVERAQTRKGGEPWDATCL